MKPMRLFRKVQHYSKKLHFKPNSGYKWIGFSKSCWKSYYFFNVISKLNSLPFLKSLQVQNTSSCLDVGNKIRTLVIVVVKMPQHPRGQESQNQGEGFSFAILVFYSIMANKVMNSSVNIILSLFCHFLEDPLLEGFSMALVNKEK